MSSRLLVALSGAFSVFVAAATLGVVLFGPPRRQGPASSPAGAPVEALTSEEPEVRFPLPEFRFTEASGQPFGREDLLGKVWVVDFVFTTCQGICPRLSEGLARLQATLATRPGGERVGLLSFSVDPEHDTPAALTAYAARYGADRARWKLVTGERAAIWGLIREGFKLPVGDDGPPAPGMPVFHSGKLALIDAQGAVRGYFDGLAEDAAAEEARILAAVDALLAE